MRAFLKARGFQDFDELFGLAVTNIDAFEVPSIIAAGDCRRHDERCLERAGAQEFQETVVPRPSPIDRSSSSSPLRSGARSRTGFCQGSI